MKHTLQWKTAKVTQNIYIYVLLNRASKKKHNRSTELLHGVLRSMLDRGPHSGFYKLLGEVSHVVMADLREHIVDPCTKPRNIVVRHNVIYVTSAIVDQVVPSAELFRE